jgi:hypothetical protein
VIFNAAPNSEEEKEMAEQLKLIALPYFIK